MEKSDELLESTLADLDALSSRLEAIAAIEEKFDKRLQALDEAANAMVNRAHEIEASITRLAGAIDDIQKALSSAQGLDATFNDAMNKLAALDIQGLKEKLDEASGEINKATSKLISAEKRSKEADKNKKIAKK